MKIKKSDLLNLIQEQADAIATLKIQVNCYYRDILRPGGLSEPTPKLKQLDQSVFDGQDEMWRFAAVDADGKAYLYVPTEKLITSGCHWISFKNSFNLEGKYDPTNWQNSLIEREGELTGSDLCKAMLERGDKYVMCAISGAGDAIALEGICALTVTGHHHGLFITDLRRYKHAVPIDNNGNVLTAKQAGF